MGKKRISEWLINLDTLNNKQLRRIECTQLQPCWHPLWDTWCCTHELTPSHSHVHSGWTPRLATIGRYRTAMGANLHANQTGCAQYSSVRQCLLYRLFLNFTYSCMSVQRTFVLLNHFSFEASSLFCQVLFQKYAWVVMSPIPVPDRIVHSIMTWIWWPVSSTGCKHIQLVKLLKPCV